MSECLKIPICHNERVLIPFIQLSGVCTPHMHFRLVHGVKRLVVPARHHMTSTTNPRSSYRPPKRLSSQIHKTAPSEEESQFNAFSDANLVPLSKRLRRSQSFESRPTSPTGGRRSPVAQSSSGKRQESSRETYYTVNNRQTSGSSAKMPRGSDRGRGGGRSAPRGRGRATGDARNAHSAPVLEGPVHNDSYIKGKYMDSHLPPVKERWLDNPKSTISNYYSLNFGKQPVYEAKDGMIDSVKMVRYVVF